MLFSTLAFAQIWQALGIRSSHDPIWRISPMSNRPLMVLMGTVLALQLAAVYVPWLNTFLGTEPLSAFDLALSVVVSSLILVVAELEKVWERRAKMRPVAHVSPQVG